MLLSSFTLLPELVSFISLFSNVKKGFVLVLPHLSTLATLGTATSSSMIMTTSFMIRRYSLYKRFSVDMHDHSRTFITIIGRFKLLED